MCAHGTNTLCSGTPCTWCWYVCICVKLQTPQNRCLQLLPCNVHMQAAVALLHRMPCFHSLWLAAAARADRCSCCSHRVVDRLLLRVMARAAAVAVAVRIAHGAVHLRSAARPVSSRWQRSGPSHRVRDLRTRARGKHAACAAAGSHAACLHVCTSTTCAARVCARNVHQNAAESKAAAARIIYRCGATARAGSTWLPPRSLSTSLRASAPPWCAAMNSP